MRVMVPCPDIIFCLSLQQNIHACICMCCTGHAYTAVMADTIARFQEMDGCDTFFLTGTDEHGQKVERSAQLQGLATIDFVNEKSENFRNLAALLHCSNTDFIRTTEDRHRKKVESLWEELVKQDMIYLGNYEVGTSKL
jgi:methionyl-tRNA synthetase